MSTKAKILDALGIALEDVSEDRLLDILLDAYAAKKVKIEQLHGENAREREDMHCEREKMHKEYRCMRSDPLYCLEGAQLFFIGSGGQRFMVLVKGHRVSLVQKNSGSDMMLKPTTMKQWS